MSNVNDISTRLQSDHSHKPDIVLCQFESRKSGQTASYRYPSVIMTPRAKREAGICYGQKDISCVATELPIIIDFAYACLKEVLNSQISLTDVILQIDGH